MTKEEFIEQAIKKARSLGKEELDDIRLSMQAGGLPMFKTSVIIECTVDIEGALSDHWETMQSAENELFNYLYPIIKTALRRTKQ
jgi:hypothetical protein